MSWTANPTLLIFHASGVAILSSIRTAEGEVRVEGFHDDVRLLSEADRAAIAEVPFDEQAYKDSIGVSRARRRAG